MPDRSRARILFVDDDPDLLSAMARSLRSERMQVSTASSAAAALELLRDGPPFAVIVSDLRMPGMDGIELLRRVRQVAPATVRVLFTGQPDLENAIAAVNEGAIFRFIVKPCPRIRMLLSLRGAIEQHQLITAERVLLDQTLHGSIKALIDILGLTSPMAFGRATRLRQAVARLGQAMGIAEMWHIDVAVMLSQIGAVILPPATLLRVYQGEPLSSTEKEMVARMPAVVEQILANIPRLEPVLEILRYQHKHFDGSGPPPGDTAGDAIPWGARALGVVLALDEMENAGISTSLAFDTLRGRDGSYDPAILDALAAIRHVDERSEVRELPPAALRPGMIFAQDVRTRNGVLLIARGQEVTAGLLEKFRNFAPDFLHDGSIRVVVSRAGASA